MPNIRTFAILVVGAALHGAPAVSQPRTTGPDRTSLPIAEPKRPVYTEIDARKVTPPPRFEVKAPAGAPNVVIVLIDDLGFGAPSTFGGPIGTPTLDQLAALSDDAQADFAKKLAALSAKIASVISNNPRLAEFSLA